MIFKKKKRKRLKQIVEAEWTLKVDLMLDDFDELMNILTAHQLKPDIMLKGLIQLREKRKKNKEE